jgi:hypothetical protein
LLREQKRSKEKERKREREMDRQCRTEPFGCIPEEETAMLNMNAMEADLRHIYKGKKIDEQHIVRAVEEKCLPMVLCLIKHGVNVKINNNAALVIAAQRGYHLIVKELVQHCDPTVPDNYALRHACLNGHSLVVKELLNCPGVDPRCNQNDPLVLAAAKGHVNVCKELLNWGVRPDARAYNWARTHKPVCDLFVEYGYKTIMMGRVGGAGQRTKEWTGKRSSRVDSNDENDQLIFVMDS